ncbi:related to transcriptional activator Mut3p [Ustilago sp. UG-2017a]|nr:related to transcriptional activator Mut3p [Ustilago sp. UG-2017a]
MSYESQDEAYAAFELVSMRNGHRSSVSFDNSPVPTSLPNANVIAANVIAASPQTAARSSSASASSSKKRAKSASDPKSSATPASKAKTNDKNAADSKGKKRRRVVVACDTCRRKKIKCQGLPNPSNTCNNCTAYNYRCTFSSDAGRSRGKYEILESKVETLLSALRSVAPHVAHQFECGELNVTGPSGASAPPQNANPWQSLEAQSKHASDPGKRVDGANLGSPGSRHDQDLPSRSAPHLACDGSDPDGTDAQGNASGNAGRCADATKGEERDALLPDVEDGRPRYFGRSSAMTLFHSIADESRPPSPGAGAQRSSYDPIDHAGMSYETHRYSSSSSRNAKSTSGTAHPGGNAAGLSGSKSSGGGGGKSTRTAPRPLYPTNSKEWIQLLRRKNTVAVGRDDAVTEEWFERYTLPDRDLVDALFDVFFEHLHPLMPIVHRPSLQRDLNAGRADKDSAFRGFVFTILAIASRFSNDPRVLARSGDADTAGDHFAAASRLYHQVYAASLINVQVMILTATFMHGAIGPGASWTVLGVAIRALQDIGLHQEKAYRGFSPYEQELRRRVFWGAFILDCIFSINMGRPLALKLSDCDVRLPLEMDDETLFQYEAGGRIPTPPVRTASDKPIVMSGFVHMIKLNVIVQDVVHVLYSPRWRQDGGGRGKPPANPKQRAMPEYKDMVILSKRLEEWVAETPRHLGSIESPFRLQAGLVQCGTHDIRLYILKPFLEHSALRKMLHPQCVLHARECLRVVIALHEGDHMSDLVFIFQQAFMSTATFMITVWHECREVDKLAEDNDLVESTLRIFAAFDDRYFSRLFRRAHRILRDIALRSMHTMTSDQRERVSRMLVRADQRMSGVVPSTMMGMRAVSGMMEPRADASLAPSARLAARNERLEQRASGQIGDAGGGPFAANDAISAASYIHSWSPIPSAPMSPNRTSVSDASFGSDTLITCPSFAQFMMSGGGNTMPGGAPNGGANGMPRATGSGSDGGVVASVAMSGATVASSRSHMSSETDAWMHSKMGGIHPVSFGDARGIMPLYTDDPGSTQHQLEDLSWTDYFSKFLDDIGGAGTPMTASASTGASTASAHAHPHYAYTPMTGGVGMPNPQGPPWTGYGEMHLAMGCPNTSLPPPQASQSPRRPTRHH